MATTSAANGKTTKSGISGVIIAKIDPDVMRAAAEDIGKVEGFDLPSNPSSDDLMTASLALYQRLYEDMEATNKMAAKSGGEPIDLVECDVCEGEAPESCERCPFCGAGGTVVAQATAPTQDEDSAPAKSGTKAKKNKAAKAVKDDASAELAPEETNMTTALATTKGADIVPIHGKKLTAKTLDKYVAEVKELYSKAARDYLAVGRALAVIRDKGLFKLRLDENGKAMYASWDAFVHHEIGITPDRSYSMMRDAENFTDDEVHALGPKKMTLIMQAPPQARPKLKEDVIKNKISKKKLSEQVKEVRKKAGYTGSTKQAQAGAKGGKAKAKKAAFAATQAKVTVALVEGKKTIKLFAKPATMRNLDLSELKRAKTFLHVPFGIIELANEVCLYVTILKDKNDELVLSYEARRPTAEE